MENMSIYEIFTPFSDGDQGQFQSGPPVETFNFELEDDSGFFELEDSTGYFQLEEAP